MAIDFDFDDFDLKELNFDSDCLQSRRNELEFDDEFPMVNYDPDDEEVEEKPKKRERTVWPCK
jgi:hypothetical protein